MYDSKSNTDPYFPPWMFTYTILLGISTISCLIGAWSLKKAINSDLSCIIFAIKWFLVYRGLYSIGRMFVLGFIMREFVIGSSDWAIIDNIHDACGTRLLTKDDFMVTSREIPLHVSMISLFADTCNLGASMWMFILFMELIRIGRRSMDRGKELEERTRRWYMYTVTIIIFINFIVFGFFLSTYHYNDGKKTSRLVFLNTRATISRLMSFVMQVISVLAGVIGLVILRWRGEQVVSVGGQVSPSPIYGRIKRIVYVNLTTTSFIVPSCSIVDCIFVLPYAVMMSILENYSGDEDVSSAVVTMIGIISILFNISGFVLALILAGSQECCTSICMSSDENGKMSYRGSVSAPMYNPVFVNTDIEGSSELWSQLGSIMHDAQELHDNLLRSLLPNHNGYEITTAGDSFQLAFHSIQDAIGYCLDVQEKLLHVRWPKQLGTFHPAETVYDTKYNTVLKKSHYLFHGLRVRMGIHASCDVDEGHLYKQTHPVTYRTNYIGLSELIGREVSDVGHGGQIVITAPVAKWLRRVQETTDKWNEKYPCILRDLGVYRVKDLKIDLELAYIVPYNLRDRIRYFTPLQSIQDRDDYTRRPSTAYDLLLSPKDVVLII